MDAKNTPTNIAPWPKQGLSEHVRAAPTPAGPRPSREAGGSGGAHADRLCRRRSRSAKACSTRPKRVIDAYEELYQGYRECPVEVLDRTFSETAGYDDFVLVKDIGFNSHCEHHMMPFFGKAHVAYMPTERVVGLSKLARLVDVYARRLQTQEHMTSQVATAIDEILKPRGVAVMLEAEHMCMSLRGVEKLGALTVTTHFTGDVPRRRERAGAFHDHAAGRATVGSPRNRREASLADQSQSKKACLSRRNSARTG